MRREREGTAKQAVDGGPVTDLVGQLPRGLERQGDSALIRAGNVRGHDRILVLQRVAPHSRRCIGGPEELTAQGLSLDLQVEHDRLAVRVIQAVGLQERGPQRVEIGVHLLRIGTDQLSGVHTGEWDPGNGIRSFMAKAC